MPISNDVDSTVIYIVNHIFINKQSTTVNNLSKMFMSADLALDDILCRGPD